MSDLLGLPCVHGEDATDCDRCEALELEADPPLGDRCAVCDPEAAPVVLELLRLSSYEYQRDRAADALRTIWRAFADSGPDAATIREWEHSTALPHDRYHPSILRLLPSSLAASAGEWCEPQIVIRWPDRPDPTWRDEPHVDEPPAWAGTRKYRRVVGVALTPAGEEDGGLRVWHDGTARPVPHLEPGDLVTLPPDLPHSGGLNLGASPRVAVYFRQLEPLLTPRP